MEKFKFEHNGTIKILNSENEVITEIVKIAKELAGKYKSYLWYKTASFCINKTNYIIAINRTGLCLEKFKGEPYIHKFSEIVASSKAPLERVNYRSIIASFVDDGLKF